MNFNGLTVVQLQLSCNVILSDCDCSVLPKVFELLTSIHLQFLAFLGLRHLFPINIPYLKVRPLPIHSCYGSTFKVVSLTVCLPATLFQLNLKKKNETFSGTLHYFLQFAFVSFVKEDSGGCFEKNMCIKKIIFNEYS